MTRKSLALGFAVIAMIAALLIGCGSPRADVARYHCPMHPTYISDRQGDCPICGMRLVPITEAAPSPTSPATDAAYLCPMECPNGHSAAPGRCADCGMELKPAAEVRSNRQTAPSPAPPGAASQVLFYRNPMNPSVTSPVPAKDSMGMDYVPVYADEVGEAGTIPGMAPVSLTPEGLHLAGVRTAPVTRHSVARTIRTVGTVVADETRIRHVHAKVAGWVEKLYVDFTGQAVTLGMPLLSIYSPELLASQEEFLQARTTAARFASSELPEVRQGGADLLAAARRRLELFDVPEAFLAALEQNGTPQRTVTLLAPVAGLVTSKLTFEGHRVEPGVELFTITDLSRVWVEAEFYESDARLLRVEQTTSVTLPYDPAANLSGRISFIDPTIDTASRTLRARVELPNPGLRLKPGMFANVELAVDTADSLVIPDSAVLDTGERQVVFVELGEGRFSPRLVVVGERSGGQARVVSGLAEGERVVVKANFLLDSESRLRAAIAGSAGTPTAHQP